MKKLILILSLFPLLAFGQNRTNMTLETDQTVTGNKTFSAATTLNGALTVGNATQARSALALGTLATQNGTFSGTSSGNNTGDQTLAGLGGVASSNGTATNLTVNGTTTFGNATQFRSALLLGTAATSNSTAFVASSNGTATNLTLNGTVTFGNATQARSALGMPSLPVVAFIGDSLTEAMSQVPSAPATGSNATTNYLKGGGFGAWARLHSGNRFIAANYGAGGQRIAEMQSRIAEAVSLNPAFVVVLAGTNNVSDGNSAATIFAALQTLCETIASYGPRVILSTLPSSTNANATVIPELNRLIRNFCVGQSRPILFDAVSLLGTEDPASALLSPAGLTVTATGNSTTDTLTASASGLANGNEIVSTSLTGGAGLSPFTKYFARDVSGTAFKLAATSGGAAIDFTTDISASSFTRGFRFFYDDLHPNQVGAQLIGRRLAALLSSLIPPADFDVPLSLSGVSGIRLSSGNPYFTGAVSQTEGTMATSWRAYASGSATVAGSVVIRDDGLPGKWQRLVITSRGSGAGTTDTVNLTMAPGASGWSVGDSVYFAVKIRIVSGAFDRLQFYTRSFSSSITYWPLFDNGSPNAGVRDYYTMAAGTEFWLVSQTAAIPTGTSDLLFYTMISGNGTIDIGPWLMIKP